MVKSRFHPADKSSMDCPSCQSKAKEIGPDRVVCGTCGDITRVDGEWVPSESIEPPTLEPTLEPAPADAIPPNPDNAEPTPADIKTALEHIHPDDEWLSELRIGIGRESD